jgi:hypothetical protein
LGAGIHGETIVGRVSGDFGALGNRADHLEAAQIEKWRDDDLVLLEYMPSFSACDGSLPEAIRAPTAAVMSMSTIFGVEVIERAATSVVR